MKMRWWLRIILVIAAFVLFLVVPYRVFLLLTENTWSVISLKLFMADWGGIIGILATLIVAILVSLIPSAVETQVKYIAERLQSTLGTFDSVYSKAFELLVSIKDDPNSIFMMISATPVFGIELHDEDRDKWARTLKQRIVSNYATRIVCLDWGTKAEPRLSPLYLFCKALTESYLKDPAKATELFCRAREDTIAFLRLAFGYSNSVIHLGSDPPLQVIISKDGFGKSKGIIYFASSKTLRQNISVTGFFSEDQRWTRVMQEIFNYVEGEALGEFRDERTQEQINRDQELLAYYNQHWEWYQLDIGGFELTISPEVFPPELGLSTILLQRAIDKIAPSLFSEVPFENRIGIDIGTGAGLLALTLSKHCSMVYATDNYEDAAENAKFNVKKNLKADSIRVLHGDLFADIPQLAKESITLIVFNHPFYPSPLNLYNNGAYDAGNPIINRFLQEASGFIENGGAILMPYSTVAAHHNPLTIATSLGFASETILSQDSTSGGKDYIFKFIKHLKAV